MRRLAVLAFLLVGAARGQDLNGTPKFLFEQRVIDATIRKQAEKAVVSGQVKEPRELLPFLVDAMRERLAADQGGDVVALNASGNRAEKAEVRGLTLKHINAFERTRLVSTAVADRLRDHVATGAIAHPLSLLFAAQKLSESEEAVSPPHVRELADRLLAWGIVDADGRARLVQDVDSGKVTCLFDLARYFKLGRGFELRTYPADPKQLVEQLHADVAALLPELKYGDLRFAIDDDPEEVGAPAKRLRVSFAANGTRYTQASFIKPDAYKSGEMFGRIDAQEFYEIFNKALSDRRSSLRLHLIQTTTLFGGGAAADHSRFALVALTKEQAEKLRVSDAMISTSIGAMKLSHEDFVRRPSPDEVRGAIAAYRRLGLLGAPSESELASTTDEALASGATGFNEIISMFPNVVFRFPTKAEVDKPYADIVRGLASISRGQFRPTELRDESPVDKTSVPEGTQKVRVSFGLGKKRYSEVFTTENGWLDGGFCNFIERAQAESEVGGRFFMLQDPDAVVFVFLTRQQADELRAKHLLEFVRE